MQSKILVGTGPSQDINLEVLIVLHGPLEVFVVLVVKNLRAKAGDIRFHSWLGKILWRSAWQPIPVFLWRIP